MAARGRTALLVIDCQSIYTDTVDTGAFPRLVPSIKAVLAAARASDGRCLIVHVRAAYSVEEDEWYTKFCANRPEKPRRVVPTDVPAWAEAQEGENELVAIKRHFSAFDTPTAGLLEVLRRQGVSHLLCCGLLTSVCVHHTAIGAHQRGFAVSVVADACADLSRLRHEAVLELYGDRYIYDVLGTEQAVAVIMRGDGGSRDPPVCIAPAPATPLAVPPEEHIEGEGDAEKPREA